MELFSTPMILIDTEKRKYVCEGGDVKDSWRCARVRITSQTFGLPNGTQWCFHVYYDSRHNFNVSAPELQPKLTVRTALAGMPHVPLSQFDQDHQHIMNQWPRGYKLEDMEDYEPELLAKANGLVFYKLPADTTAPHIDGRSLYWIHPLEIRLVTDQEMATLAGCSDWRNDVPGVIKDWLHTMVYWHEHGSWGDTDVCTTFTRGRGWHSHDAGPEDKVFDLRGYFSQETR